MKTLSGFLALGALLTLLGFSAAPAQAQSNHSRPTVNVQVGGGYHPSYGTNRGNWRSNQQWERNRWERERRERFERERRERERWERERRHHRGNGWGR